MGQGEADGSTGLGREGVGMFRKWINIGCGNVVEMCGHMVEVGCGNLVARGVEISWRGVWTFSGEG